MISKTSILTVQGIEIAMTVVNENDFISLTDIIKAKDGDFFISDWLRNRNTLEYLAAWETLNNPNFNYGEFATIREKSGLNSFKISVKEWIARTNAVGIIAKAGRYGGTYAHKDIAFNFGMWISPIFQLYIVKEYQRLKEEERNPALLQWQAKRFLTKANYTLQTDAIQEKLKHLGYKRAKEILVYAQEADMLNVVVFGCTAKEWEEQNPQLAKKKMNIRETATIAQLLVLANMETINAELIKRNVPRAERFRTLLKIAEEQMNTFNSNDIESQFRKNFPENNVGNLLE